jgi:hypothetical protein
MNTRTRRAIAVAALSLVALGTSGTSFAHDPTLDPTDPGFQEDFTAQVNQQVDQIIEGTNATGEVSVNLEGPIKDARQGLQGSVNTGDPELDQRVEQQIIDSYDIGVGGVSGGGSAQDVGSRITVINGVFEGGSSD